MGNSPDVILPIVREMRAEAATFHEEAVRRLDRVEQRLVGLAAEQAAITEVLTARWSSMRSVSKVVERHLRFLENRS